MSINWVMLDAGKNFVPLPHERILFTSAPRTSLSLTTPNTYPGRTLLNLQSSTGRAFVTTQRIIYLPAGPTPALSSFTSPLLNLHDTHVTAPFFGPNAWVGLLKPVTGGGIPPQHAYVELKLIFKDGGAYDFHSNFERIREAALQAAETARESGRDERGVREAMEAIDGEALPAYEAGPGVGAGVGTATGVGGVAGLGGAATAAGQTLVDVAPAAEAVQVPPAAAAQVSLLDQDLDAAVQAVPLGHDFRAAANATQTSIQTQPPSEDPPRYEEVQSNSVANSLEERLRREAE